MLAQAGLEAGLVCFWLAMLLISFLRLVALVSACVSPCVCVRERACVGRGDERGRKGKGALMVRKMLGLSPAISTLDCLVA
jgi:hypothetical protein